MCADRPARLWMRRDMWEGIRDARCTVQAAGKGVTGETCSRDWMAANNRALVAGARKYYRSDFRLDSGSNNAMDLQSMDNIRQASGDIGLAGGNWSCWRSWASPAAEKHHMCCRCGPTALHRIWRNWDAVHSHIFYWHLASGSSTVDYVATSLSSAPTLH